MKRKFILVLVSILSLHTNVFSSGQSQGEKPNNYYIKKLKIQLESLDDGKNPDFSWIQDLKPKQRSAIYARGFKITTSLSEQEKRKTLGVSAGEGEGYCLCPEDSDDLINSIARELLLPSNVRKGFTEDEFDLLRRFSKKDVR